MSQNTEDTYSALLEMNASARRAFAEYEEKKKSIGEWVKKNNKAIRDLLPIVGKIYELKEAHLYDVSAKYIKVKPSRVLSSDHKLWRMDRDIWPIPLVKCVMLDCNFIPLRATWLDSVSLLHVGEKVTPSQSHDKGGVYLIRVKETNLHKIGVANDASKRLAALQTGSPFQLELVTCYEVYAPYNHEKKLHSYFEQQRTQGEWFNLDNGCVRQFHEYFSA
jgi:hypothetical protein